MGAKPVAEFVKFHFMFGKWTLGTQIYVSIALSNMKTSIVALIRNALGMVRIIQDQWLN